MIQHLVKLDLDRSESSIESCLNGAKALTEEYLNGPERDLAARSLDRLSERSYCFAHLSSAELISIIISFNLYQEELAKSVYLNNIGDSIDRLNKEAFWYETHDLLLDLRSAGLKLTPFMIMAAR